MLTVFFMLTICYIYKNFQLLFFWLILNLITSSSVITQILLTFSRHQDSNSSLQACDESRGVLERRTFKHLNRQSCYVWDSISGEKKHNLYYSNHPFALVVLPGGYYNCGIDGIEKFRGKLAVATNSLLERNFHSTESSWGKGVVIFMILQPALSITWSQQDD